MKILVTGAKGFVGKNLCEALKNIRDGKDRTRPALRIEEVFEYDIDSSPEQLNDWCREADFVFNLAGVNRPKDQSEFMEGNFGFASVLLDTLKNSENLCPVMLSSSQQASLSGRFGNSEYGRSKKAGEDLFLDYQKETGAKVLVYRFPNLFGKWCRPNYNSAVATFCNNIANDLPIVVNDPAVELELLYIDDLVAEMLDALEGKEHRCEFNGLDVLPKKLYSTYLSYLPKEKISFPLKMNTDDRGSFTELIHTLNCGQVSINISKPGITKGQHWHNTKWEFFIVVSGHGLIQERKVGSDEILEFEVSGEKIEAVHMLPGYTHNIINLSETENLVTVMYCNEIFDSSHPDTFFEKV